LDALALQARFNIAGVALSVRVFMRQTRRATPKSSFGSEWLPVPSVGDLAARISALLRLRDQVRKAEIWHLNSKESKLSVPRPRLK